MNLKFVICGIEHSGTTLVSDLFRQVPGLDSGFEVGVLLADSPRDFPDLKPFSDHIRAGWGIAEQDLATICDTEDYAEFYSRLGAASTVIDKSGELFDKTPRYLAALSECMARASVPFIATCKDPRSIVYSDFKRAETEDFEAWYEEYKPKKIGYMKTLYQSYLAHRTNPQVAFVSLEELSVNTATSVRRVFEHVGVPFEYSYLLLKNLRYRNTHSNFIDMRIPFAYMESMDKARQRTICDDFSAFEDWFFV